MTQRGHNQSICFHDVQGHQLYLGLLQEFAPRDRCDVHAYVLMSNHVHLLVTPHEPESVSEFMRHVNQRYSQNVNRKHRRVGTVWQGRFKASIVDSDEYFFTCQRYVEQNPVRAGMVRGPGEYPWSSFRTNALGYPSTFVKPHERYLALGSGSEERQSAYRALFDLPITDEDLAMVRASSTRGVPLGSEDFVRNVAAKLEEMKNPGRS